MKPHKFAVTLLFSLCVVFAGCKEDKDKKDDTPNKFENVSKTDKQHDLSTPGLSKFVLPEKQPKISIVVNSDNTTGKDSLFLTVNVEVDDKGRMVFDDGNIWTSYIKTKNQVVPLYQKDIQLGKLVVYYDRDLNVVYLSENSPYQNDQFKVVPNNGYELTKIDGIPNTKNMEKLDFDN